MAREAERVIHSLGDGEWYALVQTADGALHAVKDGVPRANWAICRGLRYAKILTGEAARNYRDCRGGWRDQRIGTRCGPRNWYGTLYPRACQIVRVIAIQAGSLSEAVCYLVGHLSTGIRGLLRSVQTVVTISLAAILAAQREAMRQKWVRLVGAGSTAVTSLQSAGSCAVTRRVASLIRTGRPGAIALAGAICPDIGISATN